MNAGCIDLRVYIYEIVDRDIATTMLGTLIF